MTMKPTQKRLNDPSHISETYVDDLAVAEFRHGMPMLTFVVQRAQTVPAKGVETVLADEVVARLLLGPIAAVKLKQFLDASLRVENIGAIPNDKPN